MVVEVAMVLTLLSLHLPASRAKVAALSHVAGRDYAPLCAPTSLPFDEAHKQADLIEP